MTLQLGNAAPAAPAAPTARPTGLVQPPAPGNPYSTLLSRDPILTQSLAGLNASGAANTAQLQGQQQRALVQYGAIPRGLPAGLAGTIDATTRALANQATQGGVSTVAGLARGYQGANASALESLAARGILRSGATGARENANLQNYQRAGYNASQDLLDYLQGLQSSYLTQQDTLRSQGVSAEQSALDRVVSQINAGTLGAPVAAVAAGAAPPPTYLQHGGPQ